MNRPRKYTVVTINEKMKKSGYEFGEDLLRKVAYRKLVANGSIFLRAPEDKVKEFHDVLARKRSIQPRLNGKGYKCTAIMDTGDRLRLDRYREQLIREMPRDFDWDVTADATQQPPFSKAQRAVPTVIKNSNMYNFKAERFSLPPELLATQGVPMEEDDPNFKLEIPLPLLELSKSSGAILKSVTGNGMNIAQVGTALGAALLNAL